MLFILMYFRILLTFLLFFQAKREPLDLERILISGYKASLDIYSENDKKLGKYITKDKIAGEVKKVAPEALGGQLTKVIVEVDNVRFKPRKLKFETLVVAAYPKLSVTTLADRTALFASVIRCNR